MWGGTPHKKKWACVFFCKPQMRKIRCLKKTHIWRKPQKLNNKFEIKPKNSWNLAKPQKLKFKNHIAIIGGSPPPPPKKKKKNEHVVFLNHIWYMWPPPPPKKWAWGFFEPHLIYVVEGPPSPQKQMWFSNHIWTNNWMWFLRFWVKSSNWEFNKAKLLKSHSTKFPMHSCQMQQKCVVVGSVLKKQKKKMELWKFTCMQTCTSKMKIGTDQRPTSLKTIFRPTSKQSFCSQNSDVQKNVS